MCATILGLLCGVPGAPPFMVHSLTTVQGVWTCQHISMSQPQALGGLDVAQTPKIASLAHTACRCLSISPEAPDNSSIVDIATLTMNTIPFPLQEALRDSITSGSFVDTKFWVFSKRTSKPGRVGEPKALFVNRHVARRVPRLASRALISFVQVISS